LEPEKRCRCRKPRVSAALGELEPVTNERLFDRHGRRLVLNDADHALQPHTIALVEGAENLARFRIDGGIVAQRRQQHHRQLGANGHFGALSH
jgi:DNA-binding transcriptional LysR family regulator